MRRRRPTLVVLRALKLGDLLAAVPALRALGRAFPRHERLLAAPAWLEPLVDRTGSGFTVVDTPDLVPLDPVLHGADLAVNLHGRGPQSTALLQQAAPSALLAFDVPGGPAWRDDEHERERWCRLLAAYDIPADPNDLRIDPPDLPPPPASMGATVLHPGASSGARRWPAERWAVVARSEAALGRPVVLTGSADEVGLCRAVAAEAGLAPSSVLAGRTPLPELLAVVAASARVICGDTGVAHVASALGVPSVVLFGPTSPATWGPPADGPHVVLWAGTTGDPHAEVTDPGLLAITPDEVLSALAALPERVSS